MDVQSLRMFIVVAEERSISGAAARLHMSQPPLSVRMRALERELGAQLLVRHGRGVDLTAGGRVLLERGRRVLADLDATAEAVRDAEEGTQGRISIAVGGTVSPALVGDLLAGLLLTAPGLHLDVADLPDEEVLDRVRGNTFDAGLLHLPPPARAPGESASELWPRAYEMAVVTREPLVAVLDARGTAPAEEPIDLSLVTGPLVVPPARGSPGLHAHATAAWRAAGRTGIQECGSLTTTLALVRAGLGLALLPPGAVALSGDRLQLRGLRQHSPQVATAVVWRSTEDAPVLRRFLRAALATPEPDVLGPDVARHRG